MYLLEIKKIRENKFITQTALAQGINKSRSFVCEIEHNEYDIKLSMLFLISEFLGVCPMDLINYCKTRCKNHNCRGYRNFHENWIY